MVQRTELLRQVEYSLKRNPVTAVLGPRQCGKTTLAREIGRQEKAAYFDLEDPNDQARLANPQLTLEALRGEVILDEIQRRPELTMLLRVLADRAGRPGSAGCRPGRGHSGEYRRCTTGCLPGASTPRLK